MPAVQNRAKGKGAENVARRGLLLVWARFRAGTAPRYELIVMGDLVVKAVEPLLDALELLECYLALLDEDLPARFIRGVAFHERLTMLKLGPIIGLRANSKASVGKDKHPLLLVHYYGEPRMAEI